MNGLTENVQVPLHHSTKSSKVQTVTFFLLLVSYGSDAYASFSSKTQPKLLKEDSRVSKGICTALFKRILTEAWSVLGMQSA